MNSVRDVQRTVKLYSVRLTGQRRCDHSRHDDADTEPTSCSVRIWTDCFDLQLEEVLELLKGDQAQRTQQMEQQTDNARYLNELNSV